MATDFCIRKYIVCLGALFLPIIFFAQNKTIDSLNRVLKTERNDSLRALVFIELASNYSGYDTLKAIQALEGAYTINRTKNADYIWGYYYQCYANYLYDRGQYDRSLQLSDTAILFYKKIKSNNNPATADQASFEIAEMVMSIGATYSAMGQSENAIKKYQEALELFEKIKNPKKNGKIATIYNNIATVFFLLNQYEKGLVYDLKSIPYHIGSHNEEMLAYAYTYVASDFMRLEKHDSAKIYFDKADPLVKHLNKNAINIEYYGKIGEMYWWRKDWVNTKKYYTIAYENAKAINSMYSEVEYGWGIAVCLYYEGKYEEADHYLQQAKKLAEANDMQGSQRDMYGTLAYNNYKLKKYKLAYDYLLYYDGLKDSVAGATLKQKIAEMDGLYQSEKKQQEISQLQKEKKIQDISLRQKSLFNSILVGSVAVLLIVGFLIYRNLRNRHQLAKQQEELQRQRISELEKDRQLIAVDAMLRGQEDERSRLAKDLHDGLGGLLSGVKFSLSNMKDNLIVTPDNMAVFERSLDMIDTSIRELRRVAHNMMPEMLVKFGLDEALKEYCNTINATKLLTVKYQSFGLAGRMDNPAEIIIYRIIQELLNNILKHAVASEALVQLVKGEGRLSIVVEDNGKGFDTSILPHSSGAGWSSIKSRVEYLKGRMELSSEPGKGTSVSIEFNI